MFSTSIIDMNYVCVYVYMCQVRACMCIVQRNSHLYPNVFLVSLLLTIRRYADVEAKYIQKTYCNKQSEKFESLRSMAFSVCMRFRVLSVTHFCESNTPLFFPTIKSVHELDFRLNCDRSDYRTIFLKWSLMPSAAAVKVDRVSRLLLFSLSCQILYSRRSIDRTTLACNVPAFDPANSKQQTQFSNLNIP